MASYKFLAGEHQRVVGNFIEDAVAVLARGMTLLQRNELEVNLRFFVEAQMVPGLLAVNALLLKGCLGCRRISNCQWQLEWDNRLCSASGSADSPAIYRR